MDIKEIQSLIKFVAKSGANEVKLEMEDIKITIKTGSERTEVSYQPESWVLTALLNLVWWLFCCFFFD